MSLGAGLILCYTEKPKRTLLFFCFFFFLAVKNWAEFLLRNVPKPWQGLPDGFSSFCFLEKIFLTGSCRLRGLREPLQVRKGRKKNNTKIREEREREQKEPHAIPLIQARHFCGSVSMLQSEASVGVATLRLHQIKAKSLIHSSSQSSTCCSALPELQVLTGHKTPGGLIKWDLLNLIERRFLGN